jgi:hypothetical protein
MKFQPGNHFAKLGGRPRGARNKLARVVFEDLFDSWTEPVAEGKTLTKGKAALQTLFRERPHEYAKLYLTVMPKEFVFENVATELDDAELHQMIEALREQLRVAQEAPPALPAPKMIAHVS